MFVDLLREHFVITSLNSSQGGHGTGKVFLSTERET